MEYDNYAVMSGNAVTKEEWEELAVKRYPYPIRLCTSVKMKYDYLRAKWVREQMGIPVNHAVVEAMEELIRGR